MKKNLYKIIYIYNNMNKNKNKKYKPILNFI